MAGTDVTCRECYTILNKMCVKIEMMKNVMDNMRSDNMKIIFALIALVAANFGLKYLGTPWWLYIGVGMSIFASIFLLCCTIMTWSKINKVWMFLGITVSVKLMYASVLRIFFYHNNLRLPQLCGIPAQLLDAIVCILLVIMFWREGRWDGYERRHITPLNAGGERVDQCPIVT